MAPLVFLADHEWFKLSEISAGVLMEGPLHFEATCVGSCICITAADNLLEILSTFVHTYSSEALLKKVWNDNADDDGDDNAVNWDERKQKLVKV